MQTEAGLEVEYLDRLIFECSDQVLATEMIKQNHVFDEIAESGKVCCRLLVERVLFHLFEDLNLLSCDEGLLFCVNKAVTRQLIHLRIGQGLSEKSLFLKESKEIVECDFACGVCCVELATNLLDNFFGHIDHFCNAVYYVL